MKVLVIGSGGREHALAWKLTQSARVQRVFVWPGNGGTATGNAAISNLVLPESANGLEDVATWAHEQRIDLTVVGPEAPLAAGVVNLFQARGLRIFGPNQAAAQLESSKAFSKAFMVRHGIPTAAHAVFTDAGQAHAYIDQVGAPIVVKADGLAAGKGVVVATDLLQAHAAVDSMLAVAGGRVLIEAFLDGEEASFIVLSDGKNVCALATSQDHKRLGDGDTGPNTGGMGTYSPAEVVTPALLDRIDREIVKPSVNAIAAEGIEFCGTLFIGIMLTGSGPSVLEYNTRFGDPETQVVLPRLKTDVLTLLWAAARGKLREFRLEVRPDAAICVVIAAKGYPDNYPKGDVITFPAELPPQTSVIHAGTAKNPAGQIVTNGGRVLGVTALAPTLREAADRAYAACEKIECTSKYYRRDIGARQLNRK